MPRNKNGSASRRVHSAKAIFKFRLEQRAANQKGKEPAGEPEPSGSGLSPSASLRKMTLESGPSETDSPAPPPPSATPPSLPVHFSSNAPPSLIHDPPRITMRHRRQPSPIAHSQSSDDGRNLTSRITALEARFDAWEKADARWKKVVDRKLKDAGL